MLQPQCAIVYTVATSLFFTYEFEGIRGLSFFIPGLKTRERDGTPNPEGFMIMRSLVRKRMKEDLIEPDALDYTISHSSGNFRELLRLMRTAIGNARIRGATKITVADVHSGITEIQTEFRRILSKQDLHLLDEIRLTKQSLSDKERLHRLMQLSAVMEFSDYNGNWYEVHPVLLPVLSAYSSVNIVGGDIVSEKTTRVQETSAARTSEEMELATTLVKTSIELLISLPNVHSSDERRALLNYAGLPQSLMNQVRFEGPTTIFFQNLVPLFANYGQLPDGRYPLEAVLKASKSLVGQDKQALIDNVLQELYAYRSPQLQHTFDRSVAKGIKTAVAQVVVIIDRDIHEFTPPEQASFVFALSRIINISPDQIRILRVAEGSILVTLELSEESVQVLLSAYLDGDPALKALRIEKVELKHAHDKTQENQPQSTKVVASSVAIYQKSSELKGKIDFGIITIREDEFRAVLKRFAPETHVEGNRRYAISRIKITDTDYYEVAIVRSPEQGTGEGQDVARDMIEDLDPQWLLLVGIAGGVPSDDFTLGDVVVATRLHDFSIEAALEGQIPEYGVRGGPMHKAVQDLLAHLPALESKLQDWSAQESIGMSKPPVKLRPANIYGDEEWQSDVREKLSRQFGRGSSPRAPVFITGAIATSDKLVKSSQTINAWRKAARQILAVEMELAGVYQAARRKYYEYPILAIRSISDIVGLKRHPDWTIYACNSAAAFAYALVRAGIFESRVSQA